ncbi:hypothetical protein G3A_05540 [Bacillus sp. 17376]|nr:hypothetical protein G3A_05540 [Bacillus sp. 17376]
MAAQPVTWGNLCIPMLHHLAPITSGSAPPFQKYKTQAKMTDLLREVSRKVSVIKVMTDTNRWRTGKNVLHTGYDGH